MLPVSEVSGVDGTAHELSKVEAKDWDVAVLPDAGHLVATNAEKAPWVGRR